MSKFYLDNYISSNDVCSDYANIPMEFINEQDIQDYIRTLSSIYYVKIRYRGPRPTSYYGTLKADATHFSIYSYYKRKAK